MLDKGEFSEIYKVVEKNSKKEYALKIYNIKKEGKDYLIKCIKREIEITNKCKCENVIKIYEVIKTNNAYILILELCDIDFEKYLKDNNEKRNIYFIRKQFIGLNKALKILYEKEIMHRDIKPSNLFLKFENGECIIKLADFGISRYYYDTNNGVFEGFSYINAAITNQVGTPLFTAPEIIKGESYNYKIDLYSLGVTLYYLIFDEYPYNGKNEYSLLKNILSGKILKKTGLESLDDLIEKLLKVSPDERISFEDYFNHKFFKEKDDFIKNFKYQNDKIEKNKKEDKKKDNINKIYNIAESFIDIMNIPNGKIDKKI
jgi:serine/threonine-protein kinase ULK/ATG1